MINQIKKEINDRRKRLSLLESNWVKGEKPSLDGPTCQILKTQLIEIEETLVNCSYSLDLYDEKMKIYER